MKDYLGNEIKPGQHICFIKTDTSTIFSKTGYYYHGKEFTIEQMPVEKCWEVLETFEVVSVTNDNVFVKSYDNGFTIFHQLFNKLDGIPKNAILAIIGISDKEPT